MVLQQSRPGFGAVSLTGGSLTINASGGNPTFGAITVNQGSLELNESGATATSVTIGNGTLTLDNLNAAPSGEISFGKNSNGRLVIATQGGGMFATQGGGMF